MENQATWLRIAVVNHREEEEEEMMSKKKSATIVENSDIFLRIADSLIADKKVVAMVVIEVAIEAVIEGVISNINLCLTKNINIRFIFYKSCGEKGHIAKVFLKKAKKIIFT